MGRMSRFWIGTGWKMNHLIGESIYYAKQLKKYYLKKHPAIHIFICPPYTALQAVASILDGTDIFVGAQNVNWMDKGAMTGEISPLMVKDTGTKLVEIGHSERRSYFNETDLTINKKVITSLTNGLKPVICIGETSHDKSFGTGLERLDQQLKISLNGLDDDQVTQVIIAYEPVWAIGDSGKPADPEYVNDVHLHLRMTLAKICGVEKAADIPIIYGGSVNQANAIDLISKPEVDGLFIGRAAWQVESFIEILSMVADHLSI